MAHGLRELTESINLSDEEKVEEAEVLQHAAAQLLGKTPIEGDLGEVTEQLAYLKMKLFGPEFDTLYQTFNKKIETYENSIKTEIQSKNNELYQQFLLKFTMIDEI